MNESQFFDWLERVARLRVDKDIPELLLYVDRQKPSPEKTRASGLVHVLLGGYTAILNQVHLQRRDASTYPYPDGEAIVLGPEVFTDRNGEVISYQGRNYVPQDELIRVRNAAGRALERTEVDDPEEATVILSEVVNLDGTPVPQERPECKCPPDWTDPTCPNCNPRPEPKLPSEESLLGLWHDRTVTGRTFEVAAIEQDGYLATGTARGRDGEPHPWSCRTALLSSNYRRA